METQLKEKALSMESEKALIFIFSRVEMIVSASRGAGGLSPCWECEGETLTEFQNILCSWRLLLLLLLSQGRPQPFLPVHIHLH